MFLVLHAQASMSFGMGHSPGTCTCRLHVRTHLCKFAFLRYGPGNARLSSPPGLGGRGVCIQQSWNPVLHTMEQSEPQNPLQQVCRALEVASSHVGSQLQRFPQQIQASLAPLQQVQHGIGRWWSQTPVAQALAAQQAHHHRSSKAGALQGSWQPVLAVSFGALT